MEKGTKETDIEGVVVQEARRRPSDGCTSGLRRLRCRWVGGYARSGKASRSVGLRVRLRPPRLAW